MKTTLYFAVILILSTACAKPKQTAQMNYDFDVAGSSVSPDDLLKEPTENIANKSIQLSTQNNQGRGAVSYDGSGYGYLSGLIQIANYLFGQTYSQNMFPYGFFGNYNYGSYSPTITSSVRMSIGQLYQAYASTTATSVGTQIPDCVNWIITLNSSVPMVFSGYPEWYSQNHYVGQVWTPLNANRTQGRIQYQSYGGYSNVSNGVFLIALVSQPNYYYYGATSSTARTLSAQVQGYRCTGSTESPLINQTIDLSTIVNSAGYAPNVTQVLGTSTYGGLYGFTAQGVNYGYGAYGTQTNYYYNYYNPFIFGGFGG